MPNNNDQSTKPCKQRLESLFNKQYRLIVRFPASGGKSTYKVNFLTVT